ncbi:MAG TPA: carbohydrate-binding family 9-like protein [Candidatus Acidoferrum sp.]|nr:carbohydrate-binding family 9-like protein [Candidatus Acidoferrum sp.]
MTTTVRALWSQESLYLGFECPFTKLTAFQPPQSEHKRFDLTQDGASLWDRDVIEAFIGTDPQDPARYAEFEVAPTNERLDLLVANLQAKDFSWNSGFESGVKVDNTRKVWTCEVRIPLTSLGLTQPSPGSELRANLFRSDRANHASLAWRPALAGTFHVPQRFGVIQLSQ